MERVRLEKLTEGVIKLYNTKTKATLPRHKLTAMTRKKFQRENELQKS